MMGFAAVCALTETDGVLPQLVPATALVGQVFSTEVLSLFIRCWNPRGFCSNRLEHFICPRAGPG